MDGFEPPPHPLQLRMRSTAELHCLCKPAYVAGELHEFFVLLHHRPFSTATLPLQADADLSMSRNTSLGSQPPIKGPGSTTGLG